MLITETPIEVRYQETDQMGVVYHANYLVWFEIGRTKFVEALGLNYHQGMEKHNVVSPVIDAQISYKNAVRYGEKPVVKTWLETYDGLRTVYRYEILNGAGDLAVTGTTTHTIVDKDTFRPLSIRRKFPDWHAAYQDQLKKED
ncbi:thioesterase family protein [Oceanobacillus sp. FSL W8-0428]|uniref:4-hydroxybenzoyl-CoA thioesterase n=1 Tax=Oceanobacillus sojae TaxID=582851 RepID=A0A511ZJ40_9BACI|nr:thioesterase family protein [Oceanobacillus sojae]GEN87450.1 4-hydroxybenzoyl-CoA thioesterase [Oceanobacillus sojae]